MQPKLKRQADEIPPEQNDEGIDHRRGVPAPPADEIDLDHLFSEVDTRKKKKARPRQQWLAAAAVILVVLLTAAIGAVLALTTQVATTTRGYDAAVTIASRMGERFEAPPTLPADTVNQGALTTNFQQGELLQLAWHTWTIEVAVGADFQFTVNSLNEPDMLPIVGIYDAAGRRITAANVAVRSAEDKMFQFTFATSGVYKLLIGSIAGAPGKYEVRAERITG
jgi:hypothetical protein